MKGWVLCLLIFAGVLAAIITISICIACWPLGDEQVDEEKPPCLDRSQEARASQRRGLGIEDLFMLNSAQFGVRKIRKELEETLYFSDVEGALGHLGMGATSSLDVNEYYIKELLFVSLFFLLTFL